MPNLSPEAWARIRADYEHTNRPIEDISAEHGISSGTVRNRVARWKWTRRRPPIPREGPPAAPPPVLSVPRRAVWPTDADATALAADAGMAPVTRDAVAAPQAAWTEPATVEATPALIAQRLQGAVARVLPAIETTLGRIATGPTQPRELENAARALGALTRTLRELNALLAQHAVPPDRGFDNLNDFRAELIRKMDRIVAERPKPGDDGGGGPEGT